MTDLSDLESAARVARQDLDAALLKAFPPRSRVEVRLKPLVPHVWTEAEMGSVCPYNLGYLRVLIGEKGPGRKVRDVSFRDIRIPSNPPC